MSSPAVSSGTEPSRTHNANISAPPVMWLSTSRTVHPAQGDGLSSCSGSMLSTTSLVTSITRRIVATWSMTPPPLGPPPAAGARRSFGDRHGPGAPTLTGRGPRQLLEQQVHRRGHTVQAAQQHDLPVEVVGLDRA